MFIGHYAASFVAKKVAPQISLGAYFVAAQLLDILFSIFVLCGIEKLRIVPGFTAVNDYDLYDMPFTHSLVGALVWAVIATALVFAVIRKRVEALAFGAVVFSHFVFDVPVHTPDLPLLGNDSPKLGFGLWRWAGATIALELAMLVIGLVVYWRFVRPLLQNAPSRRRQLGAFSAALVLLTIATPFLPPPANGTAFAGQALFGYVVLALLARRVDQPPIRD